MKCAGNVCGGPPPIWALRRGPAVLPGPRAQVPGLSSPFLADSFSCSLSLEKSEAVTASGRTAPQDPRSAAIPPILFLVEQLVSEWS